MIVLIHPDLKDVEYVAQTEEHAELLAESGWKRKTPSKATAAKTEEK